MPCGYSSTVKAVGTKELELAEYYRLVRNHFVHAHGDDASKVTRQYNKLNDFIVDLREIYCVQFAPSLYQDLNFEDVIMFSRLIKNIACSLCLSAMPSDEQVAASLDWQNLKGMKQMIASSRLKQALMMRLSTEFGIRPVDSARIADILYLRLKDSPLV